MSGIYKLTKQGNSVIRLSDGSYIPFADGNRDYEDYKIWIAAGNVVDPAQTLAEQLAEVVLNKQTSIRTSYEIAANGNVTDVNNIVWNGGFDSCIKLDAAKRLSEAAGLATVRFYDVNNVAHDLTIADATTVILTISQVFQNAMTNKQTKMLAIESAAVLPTTPIDADYQTAITNVGNIVW